MRRLGHTLVIALACAAALIAAPARADDTFVKVIPPGNEKLVVEMLGGPARSQNCVLDHASIERTRIVAAYDCAGTKTTLSLHHPSDPEAASPAAKTEHFAIVAGDAPKALVEEVVTRVTAREKEWRWVSAEAPGLGRPEDGPTAPTNASAAFTPEQSEAFLAGVRLYRAGKMMEAFEHFRTLAKTVPENGVLGMVVASLASTALSQERVDRYAAEADANPADTLAQFVAGVAAHYHGHRNGQTRAEKAALYEQAIKYLGRTRPKYDFEPRVYVYLAVSHHRLGHQREAEELIEAAIPLAKNDPDVYYCRGEIFQKTNIARSIADIRTYLEMSEALEKQGVSPNAAKHKRVRDMLGRLEAAQRGAPLPDDLFDPLAETHAALAGPAPVHRAFGSPRTFGAAALAAAIVSSAVWLLFLRRPRARGG